MGPTFYRRDAVGFTLNRWFDIVLRLRPKAGKPGRAIGYLRGAASGFTSTLAHAGRPPLLVYLLPQRMDKTLFVGTTVMFFAVVNYVKLVPFYLLGQLSLNNLGLSLLFAPLAPLGVWLGLRLERWIPEKPFYRISYPILFATECKLIYDVFGLKARKRLKAVPAPGLRYHATLAYRAAATSSRGCTPLFPSR